MKTELTDEQLLAELRNRFDKNKQMLEEERKLILQLNELNEKLIASEKLKSNFLSNIRNEINNPIASILELSKNIVDGDFSIDLLKQFATLINSEAFDLDFQLRNVFLSAEIEAGQAPLSVISIDIYSLIKNVVNAFQYKIDKKEIQLTIKNSIEPSTIFKNDAEKLHLILSNLLSNAIQFNHQKGSVEIACSIENNQLKITFKDSGIGINENQKEAIYNRFHQIQEGSTKQYGGHGLGLSITKALLEIINGTIVVESTIGLGSTFTVIINELEDVNQDNDIFSSDGNDFLFDQSEDEMLF